MSRIINQIYNIKWKKQKWRKSGSCNVHGRFSVCSPDCIEIGNNFTFFSGFIIQAWKSYGNDKYNPSIIIGTNVSFMENCQLSCCSKICIGDGCLFGANVFITDNFHGNNSFEQLSVIPVERQLDVKGEVHIGKNVWIGRNVCVMPGVVIGDGAVIGSNAVVTHDIPACSVAAGIPAKVIKSIVP